MTPSDKLAKADKIIGVVSTETKVAISLWQTLEAGNRRKGLIKSLNETYAAHAWNLVAAALVNEAILVLMRVLDKEGKHRLSLQTLSALVKPRDVRQLIGARAYTWLNVSDIQKRRDRAAARRHLRAAAARLSQLLASPEYDSLRRHRDDHLAHLLDRGASPNPAKYGYVG